MINAGGGAFGYITTYLMSKLDEDIYKKIDVCAGTSIGGALALIYAINPDYKWINLLFENGCPKIFKKHFLSGLKGPKYGNEELNNFLYKILGDYKLSDINKINERDLHIIIPTLDFTLTQPRVFDNINLDSKLDIDLLTIALATTAAPTYFPAIEYIWRINDINNEELLKRSVNEQIYLLTKQALEYQNYQKEKLTDAARNFSDRSILVDGGVIENIPVITTYTTLRSELGIEPKDIDMFIIGTGDDYSCDPLTVDEMNNWTLLDWLFKFLIPYVTESNELTSVYWGALFGFNSFCYYNPLKVTGEMDDPNILPVLKSQCDGIIDDFKSELYEFLNK